MVAECSNGAATDARPKVSLEELIMGDGSRARVLVIDAGAIFADPFRHLDTDAPAVDAVYHPRAEEPGPANERVGETDAQTIERLRRQRNNVRAQRDEFRAKAAQADAECARLRTECAAAVKRECEAGAEIDRLKAIVADFRRMYEACFVAGRHFDPNRAPGAATPSNSR